MNDSHLFMNLGINTGDSLETVPILMVKTTRQNVKPDPNEKSLRSRLLNDGIAHSFYGEFLWLAPVDGKKIEQVNFDEIISKNFIKWESTQVEEVKNLTDDDIWYPIGLVMLRDALRYALLTKFKQNKNVIVFKREVYDKSEIMHSGTFVYVALGISLERILRMDGNNICICPEIVYECYDSMNRLVEDPYDRQRGILAASRCNSKEYCSRMDRMVVKIFPLDAHISNKVLSFKSWQHELIITEKKKPKGLEEWF